MPEARRSVRSCAPLVEVTGSECIICPVWAWIPLFIGVFTGGGHSLHGVGAHRQRISTFAVESQRSSAIETFRRKDAHRKPQGH